MSQQHTLMTLSIKASAALTAKQFVTAGGAVATSAGNAFGVARSDAAKDDYCPVDVIGTTQITAGGAISAGAFVDVGSSGKGVTHASGIAVAIALEKATADGDVIEVMLLPNPPAAT